MFPVIECYSNLDEGSLEFLKTIPSEIPPLTLHVRNAKEHERKIRSKRELACRWLTRILARDQKKQNTPELYTQKDEKDQEGDYKSFGIAVGAIADLGIDIYDEFSEESEYVQKLIRKLFSTRYHGFTKETKDLWYTHDKLCEAIEVAHKAEEKAKTSDNPQEAVIKARAILGKWVRYYIQYYLKCEVDENTEVKDEYFPEFTQEEIEYFKLCFPAYWQNWSIAAKKFNDKVHAFGDALGDTGRDMQENILRKAAKEAAAVPAARRTQLQNDALNAVEILDQLDFMHEKGVLSDDEYRAKRKEYMGV